MIEVPLTRGYVAMIDDADAPLVLGMGRWQAQPSSRTVYARHGTRRGGRSVNFGMHNVITGWSYIDHINGDGLDNRRANLRPATCQENVRNRRRPITNTSGYKGVTWEESRQCWRVIIWANHRQIWLGRFGDLIEAARAYDEAAVQHHGEFARLNFPKEKP